MSGWVRGERGDALLAGVVALLTVSPLLVPSPRAWWVLGLGVVASVPLAWRRRWVVAVFLLVGGATAVMAVVLAEADDVWVFMPYGALVCTYTLADIGRPAVRIGGIVLGTAGIIASLVIPHEDFFTYRYVAVMYVAAYALGTGARARRAQRAAELERARRVEEGRAMAAERERTRIARDMHDIVTHSVGLMIVQAETGPLLTRADPAKADATFESIADTGRAAVTQLRHILGTLRAGAPGDGREPRPGLDAVPTLIERARKTGLTVELDERGERRPLGPDADVSAYRIIQESLTNTIRHAGAGRADVRLAWSPTALTVEVRDDGRGVAELRPGHGLVGMRERAETCGGTLVIDPRGFTVRATLPIG